MKTVKNFEQKPLHLVSINSFDNQLFKNSKIPTINIINRRSISHRYSICYNETGKSFLLNSLIGSTTQGISNNSSNNNDSAPIFEVGHTTNQTTHGLWIWSKPLLSYDENNQITNVIVMDSEGYASVQRTHDKRLITLALLLSTCFLYNSKGVIDKDSLFDLQFVIEVARVISQKQDTKHPKETTIRRKCDFHWILRDFQLELTNQLGHKITPNEYMENCFLQAEQKVNQSTIQTLRQYFPQRSCHTLCHPNTNQEVKQQRPQFISAILTLKQQIFRKKMKSLQMSGEKFVQLLQSYINAMNQGVDMQSVFQQGYDCRVRMDCIQKLLMKLKKLQKQSQHQQEIDNQILTIKSEIKQFYHQRMCSHRLIEALDSQVEGILSEYEEEVRINIQNKSFLASSMRSMEKGDYTRGDILKETSVRCLDRSMERSRDRSRDRDSLNDRAGNSNSKDKNNNNSFTNNISNSRHVLSIPRTTGRMVAARNSILCSQDQRSFIIDEQSIDMGRTSRIVLERRSAQKQRVSAEVKNLNNKVQQFEVKLHRTQLQLSTAQCQVTHLKEQLQAVRHLLSQRQDELLNLTQSTKQQKKHLITKIQHLEEQLSQKQNQAKLLQSQIDKLNLLYKEKIQYLQRELAESELINQQDFAGQKTKYKQKIDELTEEMKQMKLKHEQQKQLVREIFKEKEMKLKTFFNRGLLEFDSLNGGKGVFEELEQILKMNQTLKQQLEQQKLTVSKLSSQLQSTQFKLAQKQQSAKQQQQQIQKRNIENQSNLKSIYQSKIESKDKQISQLQAKIKLLSENILTQNKKLIESLRQMQSHHSLEKQDLFVINSQLRNGCLQALERVAGLKEEVEMKVGWIKELEQQKGEMNTRILELKEVIEMNDTKYRQLEKQLKQLVNDHTLQLDELRTQTTSQLQVKDKQMKTIQLQCNKKEIQIDHLKHTNQQLTTKLAQMQQRLQTMQESYNELQEEYELKQLDYDGMVKQKQQEIQGVRKELKFVNQSLQQALREKEELNRNVQEMSRQKEDKYEVLEVMENQKIDKLTKRYQEQVKQAKEREKVLAASIQQKDKQAIELKQKLQKLQNELSQTKQSATQLQQYLSQTKAQLQIKQLHYNETQKQSSKQLAALKQQVKQQKQKLLTVNNDEKGKLQQLRREQYQLKGANVSLCKEVEAQKCILLQERRQHEQRLNTLKEQNQTLQSKLTQRQYDKSTLEQNLLELQQLIRTQQIQSENHIRLYNDKVNKLKQQKQSLQRDWQHQKDERQHLLKELKMTKSNYQSDFVLWTKKMGQMEVLLREAGYVSVKSK